MSQNDAGMTVAPTSTGGRRMLALVLAAVIVGGFAVAAYGAASLFQVASSGVEAQP